MVVGGYVCSGDKVHTEFYPSAVIGYTAHMNEFDFSIDYLIADPFALKKLEEFYKEDLAPLLQDFENGSTEAHDTLYGYFWDAISDDCEVVHSLYGAAPDGDAFSISICSYGPSVFYISAPAFDPIGIFDTFEEALSHAENNFGGAIYELWLRSKDKLLHSLKDLNRTLEELETWLDTHYTQLYKIEGNYFTIGSIIFNEPEASIRALYAEDPAACRSFVDTINNKTQGYAAALQKKGNYRGRPGIKKKQYHEALVAWGERLKMVLASLERS